MNSKSPFKWRHSPPDIILWGVRWYCPYSISASTVVRDDVHSRGGSRPQYTFLLGAEVWPRTGSALPCTLEANQRYRREWTKPFILVKGEDRYLYRAVDSDGNKSGLFINGQTGRALQRNGSDARQCLLLTLKNREGLIKGKNAAYPKAIDEIKAESELSRSCGITTEQISQ